MKNPTLALCLSLSPPKSLTFSHTHSFNMRAPFSLSRLSLSSLSLLNSLSLALSFSLSLLNSLSLCLSLSLSFMSGEKKKKEDGNVRLDRDEMIDLARG